MNMIEFNEWIKGHVEIVSVQGKPYLFTNLRIDRKTIPEGLFAYDVRDDNDGEFWRVQPFVMVNHWATIVGKLPVAMDQFGAYICDPDPVDECFSSEGHFIGESVTSLDEYLSRFDDLIEMARDEYSISDTDAVLAFYDEKLMVSFENIGEGYWGDYDPDNPDDVNLLRFYVERRANAHSPWEEVEDASYCTLLSASASFYELLKKLKVIWSRYKDAMANYPEASLKVIGEELSWLESET